MVNRRLFLKSIGALSLVGVVSSVSKTTTVFAQENKVPELPWPYVKLDVEYVRKMGHLGYYAFECMGGAFWGIIESVREQVGYPYTLLPIPTREEVEAAVEEGKHIHSMLLYGAGGALGWGSLCGALNGSAAAIQLVSNNWKKIGNMLFHWYEQTTFPSDTANTYASNHQYFVKKYKSDKVLPQSISHSILCHISVGRWCVTSGYASGSAERAERCARLTGDVAARAVELLNADLEGKLESIGALTYTQTTSSCRICHFKGKEYDMGQFTRGKMQCETCHQDMRPHAFTLISSPADTNRSDGLNNLLALGTLATVAVGAVAGGWTYKKNNKDK